MFDAAASVVITSRYDQGSTVGSSPHWTAAELRLCDRLKTKTVQSCVRRVAPQLA